MARTITNVTMCITCAVIIANNDGSGLCTCGGYARGDHCQAGCPAVAHALAMAEHMERTPGHWVVGTTGDTISAEPCDACGDTDHGERMHGHVLTEAAKPVHGAMYDRHGLVDTFAHDSDRTTRREAWL